MKCTKFDAVEVPDCCIRSRASRLWLLQ